MKFARNRIIVEKYNANDEYEITDRLSRVFGIHSISIVVKSKNNLMKISEVALEISPNKENSE